MSQSQSSICLPLLIVAVMAAAIPAAAKSDAGFDFSKIILDGSLWQTDAESAVKQMQQAGMQWTSAQRTSARSLAGGQKFCGLEIIESGLWTENDKITKTGFLLYSHGDSGGITEDQFDNLLRNTVNYLNGKFTSTPEEDAQRGPVTINTLTWNEDNAVYTLEWSVQREIKSRMIPYRAEFLRLMANPPAKPMSLMERAAVERARENAGTAVDFKPVRRDNGDLVMEGIPMIDQGPKGYCVVATAERVLRYYGRDVDQHEMAQLAGTSAAKGTSLQAMHDSIKELTGSQRVSVSEKYMIDGRDFDDMIRRYNRYAGRNGKKEIKVDSKMVYSIGDVMLQMDGPTLSEARSSSKADFGRFQRIVQRAIDDGTPVLWSVMLGLIKEPEIPQASGGHTRLIIGYNDVTGDILYSDSWGKGHEEKRMKAEDAWAITLGLSTITAR